MGVLHKLVKNPEILNILLYATTDSLLTDTFIRQTPLYKTDT